MSNLALVGFEVVASRHASSSGYSATFRVVAVPMSTHLAERLRRLRADAGLTQEDVAERATTWGLSWKPATVSAIEGEQRALTVPELLLLPAIIGLPLVEIVAPGDGMIELAPGLVLDGSTVRRLIQSVETWDTAAPFGSRVEPPGPPAETQALEAERQAARKLGVHIHQILDASMWLWGQSLTAQRNVETAREVEARGGDLEGRRLQALRGHVTRRLLAAIEGALQSGAVPVLAGVVRGPDGEIPLPGIEEPLLIAGGKISPSFLANLLSRSGDAEQSAARALGVGISEIAALSMSLWGGTLSEQIERELRLDPIAPDASARRRQAAREQVVRRLVDALQREMDGRVAMEEAAEVLGRSSSELAKLSLKLWGRFLPDERDRIVAQHDAADSNLDDLRTEITRQLMEELAAEIRRGLGAGDSEDQD